MKHVFVTTHYAPDFGSMARRTLEIARRYPDPIFVATVAATGMDASTTLRFDAAEEHVVERQSFSAARAGTVFNRFRWARWLERRCRDRIHVMHCGDIRPAGYAVWWTHKRLGIPYIVYVNGTDLLEERESARQLSRRRRALRLILGDAAGIVATSQWCADLAREVMDELGISEPPPVAEIGLGVDPNLFHPKRDTGSLRQRWGIRRAPILLTVAPLVPHKGQDVGIRALAKLRAEFPTLRYILIGEGDDEARLRNLAAELDVINLVGFAGTMRDDELPETYATATIYLGASRVEPGIWAEGFGISFVEASAAGLPIVAGDSGGVRSAVRDGETGLVVNPTDVDAVAAALERLLRDETLRAQMSEAGRSAAVTRYDWQHVVDRTAQFVESCVARRPNV